MQDNKLESDARQVPSLQLTELLCRALLDQELRERLLADPEAIGRELIAYRIFRTFRIAGFL